MPIVADTYDLLIGVDTHAATHTFAIVDATTGALAEHREFPTTPAGLRRAQDWIRRRTDTHTAVVLIDGAGSYGAILADQLTTAGSTSPRLRTSPTRCAAPAARATPSTPPRSPAPPAGSPPSNYAAPGRPGTGPSCAS